MKRILCIVTKMDTGGAETFLMKLYRKIDKEKYQFDFCVSNLEKGFYDEEIKSMGGRIHHITAKSKNVFRFLKSIYHVVKENKYEYVLRTSQNSLSALELLIAKFAGAKVTVFRSSNSKTMGGLKNDLVHKLFLFLPKIAADVKIAPSDVAAEFMFGKRAVNGNKVLILNNAIDYDYFAFSKENRKKLRDELGLNCSFVVGHIGRFTYQKNHKFLIEIFEEISKKRSDAKLLLIGDGEYNNQIRDLVKEHNLEESVLFLGVRKDIPDLLSAMDVFVFPSFYEGMPNTVIEAQASGLVSIISDTITEQADITGLVNYMSLEESAKKWANVVINKSIDSHKKYTKKDFIRAKYEINSSVDVFVEKVFNLIK